MPGDEPFRITFGEVPKRLIASIEAVGILNPLLVRPHPHNPEKFQVVLGYSRFNAARMLKISVLPCYVTERDFPEKDLLLANIYDNLSQRDLNPIEQAIALKKALSEFAER